MLTISRGATGAALAWTHPQPTAIAYYEVWRSLNAPYFAPAACSPACTLLGTPSAPTYVDTQSQGIGDMDQNYFYRVRAVKPTGAVSALSNTVGEFDFSLMPGSELGQ